MATLLSDLCAVAAERAAIALDARAHSGCELDPDEALGLSRLLQLCALALAPSNSAAETWTLEQLLEEACRDADLVDAARLARRQWAH